MIKGGTLEISMPFRFETISSEGSVVNLDTRSTQSRNFVRASDFELQHAKSEKLSFSLCVFS